MARTFPVPRRGRHDRPGRWRRASLRNHTVFLSPDELKLSGGDAFLLGLHFHLRHGRAPVGAHLCHAAHVSIGGGGPGASLAAVAAASFANPGSSMTRSISAAMLVRSIGVIAESMAPSCSIKLAMVGDIGAP